MKREEILDDVDSRVLFFHNGSLWSLNFVIIFLLLLFAFSMPSISDSLFTNRLIPLLLFVSACYWAFVAPSSYKIYENEIEFFNFFRPFIIETLQLEQVKAAKYEDKFTKGLKSQKIVLKTENGETTLELKKANKINNVITILTHLKKQGIPLEITSDDHLLRSL